MALETPFSYQDDLALEEVGARIAGGGRLQVRHEVGHLGRADLRPRDAVPPQGREHGRRVVPEPAGQLVRALRLPELLDGRPRPRLAPGHVTASALLGGEHGPAALGVSGSLGSDAGTSEQGHREPGRQQEAAPTASGRHRVALAV
jgi:hypothetical protein